MTSSNKSSIKAILEYSDAITTPHAISHSREFSSYYPVTQPMDDFLSLLDALAAPSPSTSDNVAAGELDEEILVDSDHWGSSTSTSFCLIA
ncbi:hypothetical protein PLICRDRAFT_95786 [Plicaturopsis crispa FD-325 SS-3]|uniref:Uncharacterized protein n=1 Tax=Plicaturopsis crispa FD-325 SS-3 TaxID=944288 RepID=A0A0C9SQJ0_PLICR|nr:hypothetical protein PLICRDRAFT_95786 [Plicaturopsis crispa FD-325 SS-3]